MAWKHLVMVTLLCELRMRWLVITSLLCILVYSNLLLIGRVQRGLNVLFGNFWRMRLSLTNNNLCPACDNQEENLLHLFRDCDYASVQWQFFIWRNDGNEFYSIADWKMWLQVNLSMTHVVHDINWSCYLEGCYILWCRRNRVIFHDDHWTAQEIIHKACNWVRAYQEAAAIYKSISAFNLVPGAFQVWQTSNGIFLVKGKLLLIVMVLLRMVGINLLVEGWSETLMVPSFVVLVLIWAFAWFSRLSWRLFIWGGWSWPGQEAFARSEWIHARC